MSGVGEVALLVQPGERAGHFAGAIAHSGGHTAVCGDMTAGLPPHTGGLLIAGDGPFGESESVPPALQQAISDGLPVLGIGWGMHALNVALGGQGPVAVEGHGTPPSPAGELHGGPVKHPVFIAPGGKVSYTIAGSGWVTIPSAHTHGLMPAQVADGLLSSVYAEDRVVEAIEKPGREWLIGVQWPAHLTDSTPKGFDSLLLALVERSQR